MKTKIYGKKEESLLLSSWVIVSVRLAPHINSSHHYISKTTSNKSQRKNKKLRMKEISACVLCLRNTYVKRVYTIEAFMIHIFEKISLEYI